VVRTKKKRNIESQGLTDTEKMKGDQIRGDKHFKKRLGKEKLRGGNWDKGGGIAEKTKSRFHPKSQKASRWKVPIELGDQTPDWEGYKLQTGKNHPKGGGVKKNVGRRKKHGGGGVEMSPIGVPSKKRKKTGGGGKTKRTGTKRENPKRYKKRSSLRGIGQKTAKRVKWQKNKTRILESQRASHGKNKRPAQGGGSETVRVGIGGKNGWGKDGGKSAGSQTRRKAGKGLHHSIGEHRRGIVHGP